MNFSTRGKKMYKVNVLEAKTNFSKLLSLLESGEEKEVIICKHDKPIATMTKIPDFNVSKRIGIAEGKLIYPDDINAMDDEIADMFYGEN